MLLQALSLRYHKPYWEYCSPAEKGEFMKSSHNDEKYAISRIQNSPLRVNPPALEVEKEEKSYAPAKSESIEDGNSGSPKILGIEVRDGFRFSDKT
jgi:hypothetical protein